MFFQLNTESLTICFAIKPSEHLSFFSGSKKFLTLSDTCNLHSEVSREVWLVQGEGLTPYFLLMKSESEAEEQKLTALSRSMTNGKDFGEPPGIMVVSFGI